MTTPLAHLPPVCLPKYMIEAGPRLTNQEATNMRESTDEMTESSGKTFSVQEPTEFIKLEMPVLSSEIKRSPKRPRPKVYFMIWSWGRFFVLFLLTPFAGNKYSM